MRRWKRSRTLTGTFALPLLAALGLSTAACSGEPAGDIATEDEAGFKEVVYVVRQHTAVADNGDVDINVAGGMGQVMDHGRYVPGGRIEVLNLATKETRNILVGERFAGADVHGMHLHYDATKVVFGMKLNGGDNFHIYTANITKGTDEENPYSVQQLTFGNHDDFYPIWVAGDKIAFVTTQDYTEMGRRADEYNHARQVPQIGVITAGGGDADRKLCSQNLSNSFNLFPLKSGRIGFSRWEHLENVNDSKLFAMNPDCTQMIALAGQHGKPANSLVQVVESRDRNVFIAVSTSRENTLQAGALVRIDAASDHADHLHDEERATYDVLTPAVPRGEEESAVGRYRTPSVLPDNRILVSWADGYVNELNELSLTPPDYGIYIYDPATRVNKLIHNNKDTWELFPQAVAAIDEPPIISSIQNSQDPSKPMMLGSVNVANTSLFEVHGNRVSGAQFDGTPVDEALQQAVKVRIIEGFSSEAAAGVNMFGLTMAEGAAILGEAVVRDDGSWLASVPPFIPYHLQPLDEFELAIRNQTTWIQGMPGEDRVCGGCHESRTEPNSLSAQQLPIAAALPEDFMVPVTERTEYPWFGATESPTEIQKILDAKCVSCHNETQNGSGPQEFYSVTISEGLGDTATSASYEIPRLDLTSRPITVYYDMDVAEYPASYVSIFYPAAMEMEMGEMEVQGTIPPAWGVPSDARNSALVEKLNIASAYDANKYAWPLGEAFSNADIRGGTRTSHPEDVGIELTREERAALIRVIDMGGQYYARQNTGFVPYGSDPLGGSGVEY